MRGRGDSLQRPFQPLRRKHRVVVVYAERRGAVVLVRQCGLRAMLALRYSLPGG